MKHIFFSFIIVLSVIVMPARGQTSPDSLERQLDTLHGKARVEVLSELCWQLAPIDIEKAEKYGKQALALAFETDDSLLIAQVYNDLGTVFYRKSDYDSAIIFYQISSGIRTRSERPNLVAACDSKIGSAYQEQGKFELSAKFQLKALQYFEQSGDSIRMSQCYNNLARVYYDNHEYRKSIEYNNKALEIFRKFDYTYGIATASGSLALNFEMLGDLPAATQNLEIALELFQQINDKSNIATALLNLGHLYRKQHDNERGIKYYTESLKYSAEAGDQHTYAVTLANLANMMTEKGNYKQAENYYMEALDIAENADIKSLLHQVYRGLAELYEKKGNFLQAYNFKQKQYNVRDSIYNIEKYEQISELQAKYETEKKEQAIHLLTAENEVQNLEIRRQRNYILFSVIGLILVTVIMLLWINRKRLQQKAVIEAEKNKYRKQLLEASVEATESERKRIARELHDGIAQQLTGLKMAWQVLKKDTLKNNAFSDKITELTGTLDRTADEVRNLSHQMMPRVLSEAGLVAALDDMLEKTLKYSSIDYSFEHFSVDERFYEKTELSLFRICQELVNNSLKHSGAQKIMVQLFKSKDRLVLMVEDNGKGIETEETRQGGIGMMNIASRVDTVNGEINFGNNPDGGAAITVRVPLSKASTFK